MSTNCEPLVYRADIAAVLHRYPSLSAYGLGHGDRGVDDFDFDRGRRYLLDALDEVQCALDWLRDNPHAAGSSYRLKHDVERACGGYVCNGALVVAVVLLGLPMRGNRNCVNPIVVKKRTAPGAKPSAVAATRPAPTGTSR